jgi:hypothetical protein
MAPFVFEKDANGDVTDLKIQYSSGAVVAKRKS